MKLSVVIPAYNAAVFVEKAYQQFISQNLHDFEIIYVDNNSKDNTVALVNKLVEKDKRVRLLQQAKQGASAARNKGIQNALGEFIYVFDVDDEIYPNALNRMIEVLENDTSIDAVFGKMIKSYKGIKYTSKPKDETHEVVLKETPYWGLYWFNSLKTVVGPPAFLYRRRVFNTIGYYNEAIRNNEDTALDIKLGMLCKVAFLDTYVYLYFKHENSTIQTSKRQMQRAFMVWPRLVKEHLPFYFQYDVPKRFETLLFSQLFQSIGRQIYYTSGFFKRFRLKKQLCEEISAVKIPLYIRLYLVILAVLPFGWVHKVYRYYVVRYAVKHLAKQKSN